MNTKIWGDHLKYPRLLFFILLFAKILYVYVESHYNYEILDTLTQASLNTKVIDDLNEFGHRISSIGLTLLLIPLFYLFFKRYKVLTMYLLISLSSIVSYLTIKHSLNVMVDTIVESHSDKRYNAYYTNIFKYGILNNHFSYDSFISSKSINEENLSIDDKVLTINTFLITYADKELIDKLLTRGSNKISELYLDMDKDSDYIKSYDEFDKFSNEITQLWIRFGEEKEKLIEQINKLKVETNIQNAYKQMQDEITHEYKVYKSATKEIDAKIQEEIQLSKLQKIEKQLKKYYKYRKHERAQQQYKQVMTERFGHYIEPDRWCSDYVCPTKIKIISVIKEEIQIEAKDKLEGIPTGLSANGFLKNIRVKSKIAKKLKKKGIFIPKEFDYTYKQFKKYYTLSLAKKEEMMKSDFYTAMEKELGKNDIKLNHTWNDFIMSKYVAGKIKDGKTNFDNKTLKRIQLVLISKNIVDFREKVYLPSIEEKVERQIYTEKDFNILPEAMKKGDDALKLLYVPPFALALSMIALLLNLVTVLVMFSMLFPDNHKRIRLFIKPILFALFLLVPFISNTKMDTPLIDKVVKNNPQMEKYVKFLEWLKYYEALNYKFYH